MIRAVPRGPGSPRAMEKAMKVAATTVVEVTTVAEVATVVALPACGGPSHAAHENTDDGGFDGGDGSERDEGGDHVARTTWAVPRGPRRPPDQSLNAPGPRRNVSRGGRTRHPPPSAPIYRWKPHPRQECASRELRAPPRAAPPPNPQLDAPTPQERTPRGVHKPLPSPPPPVLPWTPPLLLHVLRGGCRPSSPPPPWEPVVGGQPPLRERRPALGAGPCARCCIFCLVAGGVRGRLAGVCGVRRRV